MEKHRTTEATILPFPNKFQETIAGRQVDLGALSIDELALLEAQCAERADNAADDLMIVRWFRERYQQPVLPDDGGAA